MRRVREPCRALRLWSKVHTLFFHEIMIQVEGTKCMMPAAGRKAPQKRPSEEAPTCAREGRAEVTTLKGLKDTRVSVRWNSVEVLNRPSQKAGYHAHFAVKKQEVPQKGSLKRLHDLSSQVWEQTAPAWPVLHSSEAPSPLSGVMVNLQCQVEKHLDV